MQQLVDQLVQFSKVWCPHIALDDVALLVDHKGGGGQLDIAPRLGSGASVVDGDLEGQLPCLHKVHHIAGWVVTHGHS